MARKFMQTFLVAKGCKDAASKPTRRSASVRCITCRSTTFVGTNENTFEEQNESDPIIEDLEVAADALREELHLFANRKGAMVGNLKINDSGDDIDLARLGSGGWAVPSICEPNVIKLRREQGGLRPLRREGSHLQPLQRGQILAHERTASS